MRGKQTIRWILIGFSGLALTLIIAGFVASQSQVFHRFLLRKIVQKASQSTGANVKIAKISLRWYPFTADLYGIIARSAPAGQPDLFRAEHLRIGLRLRPLLQRRIDVESFELDRPEVNLRVDERGKSNLPQPASHSPSTFSVEMQHVAIRDGLLNYNDAQIPLSADLRGFNLLTTFDPTTGIYKGSLNYREGIVLAKGLNAVEHRLHANFSANAQELTVNPLQIQIARSQFTVHAAVRDYASPKVDGEYDAAIITTELADILRIPSLPAGEVALSGAIHYEYVPNRPFLRSATIMGKLASKAIVARFGQTSVPIGEVHAIYRLSDADLRVEEGSGKLLDGRVYVAAEIQGLDANMQTRVNAKLQGISLQKLSAVLPPGSRGNITLLGSANVETEAAWPQAGIKYVKLHSNAEIFGPAKVSNMPGAIPVNGVLDLTYDGPQESVSFSQAQLQTGSTRASLTGILSQHSALNVDASTSDLHELGDLIEVVADANRKVNQSKGAAGFRAPNIYGAANFTGRISGAASDPRVRGQLSAANLTIEGTKWQTLRAAVDVSSSRIQLANGYVQADPVGTIAFSGQAELQHWSIMPASPLNLSAKVDKFPISELEHLAKVDYPVSGDLNGELSLAGSEQLPQGHGSLQMTRALAWSQPVDLLRIDFRADKESVHATGLVKVAAGAVSANVKYFPAAKRYEAELNAPSIDLKRVQVLRKSEEVPEGVLTLSASGKGTLDRPQLHVTVQIPDLQLGGQAFSRTQADLDLTGHHLEFSADSNAIESHLQSHARIDLEGDYPVTADIEVRGLPIAPLLAKYAPGAAQGLQGNTEIHASLSGPLKRLQQLAAQVEIPHLQITYRSLSISNDGPIRVKYANGVANVEQAAIKGNGTELRAQGTVPLRSAAPVQLSAKGNVDVRLLQLFVPDADASGKIGIDLRVAGKISDPVTQGQIRIENAAFNTASLPVSLSAINGEMEVTDKRLTIGTLSGTAGGGTVSATGSLVFGNGIARAPEFNLIVQAKSVRAHAQGIRSTLDGNAQLTGTLNRSILTGQVLVDRLSFQPGFDLGTFMSQFGGAPVSATPSPFLGNMKLNLSVQSTRNLNLASNQLSIEGSANLTVAGTAADPVILGRIALTGGEVFFLSKRFEIQSGTIAFANPVRTEPVVSLYVNTTVQQYKITMNFQGPVERLKTTYTSDPPLPPVDIINLLAFGETAAQSASTAAVPASVGAESVLAQGVTGQLAKGIQGVTGITQLTINPLSNTSQNPASQLAVQQRISGNVLVTFSTDITTTQNQAVQLEYQPKRNITLSILRDEFGGYGLDVQWHKVF